MTAEAVARTAVQRGLSRLDFAAGYRPVCRGIAADNRYGRMLFRLWAVRQQTPSLLNAWQRAIQAEANVPSNEQIHTRVLWGMFTGSEPYRTLFGLTWSRAALHRLWRAARQARSNP